MALDPPLAAVPVEPAGREGGARDQARLIEQLQDQPVHCAEAIPLPAAGGGLGLALGAAQGVGFGLGLGPRAAAPARR
jgi:hypothetical protein